MRKRNSQRMLYATVCNRQQKKIINKFTVENLI